MKKLILFLNLFLFINISFAQIVENTTPQNTSVKNTTVGNPDDWGLTQEEWVKYQQFMQGPDGHWYPQLTPPEILGLNAKTLQEQQRFAEIVAKEEHDKLARELAFNNAVHQAMLRLYANEPIIQPFNLTPFNPVQVSVKK